MIEVFFVLFALGVGIGMGTVLQKHLFVKKAPTTFRWNEVTYVVQTKQFVDEKIAAAVLASKVEAPVVPKKRPARKAKPKVAPVAPAEEA